MGREVRMVPPGWEHPKNAKGKYIPLLRGPFSERLAEWEEEKAHFDAGEEPAWHGRGVKAWRPKGAAALSCASYQDWAGKRPKKCDYMPEWPADVATMLVMYEDTSEGTPISPAFATPEELARWLADSNASAFAGDTASYDEWLHIIKDCGNFYLASTS